MKNIAIDGPAGAGKSTISKAVSKQLGYIYVDTGALYRAVGYYVTKKGVNTSDEINVSALLSEISVELKFVNAEQRVFLNGEDVSNFIRTPEISMAASAVSALPPVRQFLFETQQKIARENNVVMDGRDIGTVVLPNADVKIFLTASPEERARRRYDELVLKGENVNYDDVLKDVITRDYNDSHRAIAPLKQADDAILVDTTGNTLEKSIEVLLNTIKEHL
jgi:cytidylate kinase